MYPQVENDFCKQIDLKVSRSTALSMLAVTAAAVISALLMYILSPGCDLLYSLLTTDAPTDTGNYTILESSEDYSDRKCSVSVENVHISENEISTELKITAGKREELLLNSSYFDIYLTAASGCCVPIRCNLKDVGQVVIRPGETASVVLSASDMPENFSDNYIISAVYRVPDSQKRVEFVIST